MDEKGIFGSKIGDERNEKKNKKKGRIHRILYSFRIAKMYAPIKRFVQKKEEINFGIIIQYIKSLFTAGIKKEEKAKKEVATIKMRAPSINLIVWGIAALIVLLLVGIPLIIILTAPPSVPTKITEEVKLEPPSINFSLLDSGVLDSGPSLKFYSTLELNGSFNKTNVNFLVYRNPIPREVFILRSTRLRASYYNEFKNALKNELEKEGLSVSEITSDEVMRLSNNSRIVLIVPSGYLPSFFVDGPLDMKTFTERGNVLIYIGYAPTEGVLKKGSEIPQPVSEDTIKGKFGITFIKEMKETNSTRLNYTNPFYTIQPYYSERLRTEVRTRAGEISVNWGGDGYVYFIPTTLDDWWSYAKNNSAANLAHAIAQGWWEEYYTTGNFVVEGEGNETNKKFVVFTDRVPAIAASIDHAYGRISAEATKTKDNITSSIKKILDVEIKKRPNGRLEHSESFISSILTGKELEIVYSLNEEPQLKHIYLTIVNSSGENVSTTLMAPEPVSLKVSKATYRFFNDLPSGSYILKITDSDGRLLASSYFEVPSFRIERKSIDWTLGIFTFEIYLGGEKNPYPQPLKNIKVSLDGKDEITLEAERGEIRYNVSYSPVPGPHKFTFLIGADTIVLDTPYIREKSLWEKPEYQLAIILTIMFFGIGMLVRPKEEVFYSIDVPEFPPLHTIAIPIKRETVLNLFNQINKELRWQTTPLSLADLKNGFTKLTFRGRPIIIGDYNLEHILDTLIKEGSVKKALDYYGLTMWEQESKKSMYYLAMQRMLRDLFVIEGIPFLPFGQRIDCDTMITIGGEKIFIHIYESEDVIERAIATAAEGRTVVVFEDEEKMKEFTSKIHSPAEANVTFKLLLESPLSNLNITPVKNLINVLHKRFTFSYY